MDPRGLPAALAAALQDAGYRVGGPAGVGGGGPVWTASRVGPAGAGRPVAGTAERVVVRVRTVPDAAAGARLAARLQSLWELAHPHLPEVLDVVTVPAPGGGETWAVLLAEVPGATVGALLAARGRLSVGEVVTLTVPVAGALDALHRVGLVHGDVSPANLVVRPDGRPVLIDVLGRPTSGDGTGDGPLGTPGFVAPELAERGVPGSRGAAPGGPPGTALPAAAPADVFALASVALAALDLAAHRGRLGDELRAACAADPVRRPTAAELAAALYACADPEPIAQPDAGVLARTALAQLAAPSGTVSVPTGARHRAGRRRGPRRGRGPGTGAGAVTGAGEGRARPASARAARGRRLVAGGALVVAGAAWGLVGQGPDGARPVAQVAREASTAGARVPAAPVGPPAPTATPTPTPHGVTVPGDRPVDVRRPAVERPDPVDAAVALTRRRAAVLASGEPSRLAEVAAPGGAAHRADLAVMRGLAAAGVTLAGISAVVEEAALVRAGAGSATQVSAPGATTVDVRVRAGLTAHDRTSPSGTTPVAAEPPRTVVLRLTWTDAGWRVAEVRPG